MEGINANSMDKFQFICNQYVEACKDLPSIELVPRLPKEDLDEALKIVRVAAILGSLKKVE